MGKTVIEHIEFRPSRDGQLRAFIVGTRVRVQDVYFLAEAENLDPDRIVLALPQLTLGQVHAALSYYFDHRDEILAEIRQDDTYAARLRGELGPGPLERIRNAKEVRDDDAVPPG